MTSFSQYPKDNLSSSNNNLHIYTDSQAAVKAITEKSRESYHKNTIRNVRKFNEHLPDGR